MKFHDYLANKGLRNQNTVAARKAAANKMLGILDDYEAADLRQVDLEQLSERFFNLNKTDFTPESLGAYWIVMTQYSFHAAFRAVAFFTLN